MCHRYRIPETATIVLDQELTFRLCKLSISWLHLHYETLLHGETKTALVASFGCSSQISVFV